jgi:hypothetical protein
MFRNVIIFYAEELLAPLPTQKLEDHPLSAVRDCLFNIFAATIHMHRPFLHPQPEDAPCRGDRDPLIVVSGVTAIRKLGTSSDKRRVLSVSNLDGQILKRHAIKGTVTDVTGECKSCCVSDVAIEIPAGNFTR